MTVVDLNFIDTGPVDTASDTGAGEGEPPLVLIHGIGATSRDWDYVLPRFIGRRRVIAPDLRGYGRSPQGPDYTVPALAGDVWALLDRLGIGRFDLVGHSMGGAVALQMAVDHPERVCRAVFADTLPSLVTDTLARKLFYWGRAVLMLLLGPQHLTRMLARRTFSGEGKAAVRARIVAHGGGSRNRFVYLRTLRGVRGWQVVRHLHRIVCPCLILVAERDFFPLADAERFAAALPNVELQVIAEAHHYLPLEVPVVFAAALDRFFDAHPVAVERRARGLHAADV